MSPVVHLVLAILIGMAVGLLTSWRRYGGVITLIASPASFAVTLRSLQFRLFGFLASGAGVGVLLVILGMHYSLAIWAHERVRKDE